jgi:nitronate monooxygenase
MTGASPLRTPLCERLGIDIPIVQAPIGRAGGPSLAGAVSNAGGLGMLGMTYLEPDSIRSQLREVRTLTDHPVGVNFLLAWDQRERLDSCLEEGASLVSLFWADPDEGRQYIEVAHDAGALVMYTVGSSAEAERAVTAGADVIVAQGWEAGGHVWGSVGTLALIPAVIDAVAPVPVIAAGGIGDGRGLAAVLALGAQAAWMGTRFVVADEALSHDEYRDRVVSATETDAVWSTGVFDESFPDSPVRTLDNTTLKRWREAASPAPGARPGEGDIVAHQPDGEPIPRYSFAPPVEGTTGQVEAMANYAGQSVGVVRTRGSAAAIVRDVSQQAERTLASFQRPPTGDGGRGGS